MKKMLKNQKGFSLVELLIVIAIMGVLAAVAFSMFAGVLGNSKRRADERTADQIAKAISAYMVDTGDTELTVLKSAGGGSDAVENVIVNLQKELWIWKDTSGNFQWSEEGESSSNPDAKKYGPYLTPKDGKEANYESYAPQWDKHIGYYIEYYPGLMKADVTPVEEGGEVGVAEGE
ncbi:type II secretion system protein [Acetivibrio thermocellus]|uniref:type II secretion system protein n=1 Tax=Acetivibrio thermocellus TaxID=1515 RepID=UPI0010A5D198|nr:type II secretion system protein [Acetivibrio thermocellus]THJ76881.1 type II secretion system protein [Acetivibrio thermocellus]